MLQLFLSIERQTTRLALLGAVLMLVVSVALGFYQVLTRFVFDAPSTWSEVISRSAMVWCVFLGAAAGFRGGFMMSVEVIYKLVPGRRLVWLEVLIALCCSIVLVVLIYFGTAMMLRVRSQMLSGLEVSIAWAYAAMPVGASFALVAVLARLLAQASGLESIGPANEEAEIPETPARVGTPEAGAADDTAAPFRDRSERQ
ncbi:TRAP transporter small permease [Halomonas sp. CKK8]|uniref:TRAP transporter small permease n=1 Tax=Halomonas sp. CKK8 TaxID=3036127 RepID=UPI0024152880|nr:TRAP transporter small permease [Halomonas sp. CKK8]WFM71266.1 TRAP transporter small permease [Halomonas sp. CKK8]